MNVNLEAEQVVKEEEESAPGKKRGFKNNKTLMIIGGVVVLEAVILMGLFSFMGGGSSEAAGDPRPTFDAKNFNDVLLKAYKLEVGPVSIYDEAVSGPGADRRYSMSVDVWLKEEAKNELVALEEQNPMAKELLQRMLEREIRAWMLQQGGQQLKESRVSGAARCQVEGTLGHRGAPCSSRRSKKCTFTRSPLLAFSSGVHVANKGR